MGRDRGAVDLIETLYGGLLGAPPWEDFLRALARATAATYATLLIGRDRGGIDAHVTPGADPDRTEAYRQIAEADPFVGLPEGRILSFRDFVSHVPARFQHWMDEAGTGQILGVDLRRGQDGAVRLRLTRDHSLDDFGAYERKLVTRLIPHLRIALDIHARLTTTQAESQLFSSAMAGLAVATLILDRNGQILRRNAVAGHMLDAGDIIADPAGRLELRSHAAAATIARLLAVPPDTGQEILFEIVRPDGPPIHGRARAIPSSAYGDGAWLALFLTNPDRPGGPSADILRDCFQLTPAEAALALHLCQDIALSEAAATLNIAYNTARSHLRAIFAKTGTHRQAQLVTLLRAAEKGGFDI